MSEANGADSPTEQQPAQDEKQSATCGCIALVVILGVIIALSFWACSACGGDDAPTVQSPNATAAASSSPSDAASASPRSSAPSPVAQSFTDDLVGDWVTTRGPNITLRVVRNGEALSAVLTLRPRPPVFFRPEGQSDGSYRAKAPKLTDGYVNLRFESSDALKIWFITSWDGSEVKGILHQDTYQPPSGGGSGGSTYQSAGQRYTMAQYSRLAVGMTFEQVNAIMGGGGIMVAQEDVRSMLVYQNVDAAGSQIVCSFEYDILVDYSEVGL